MLTHPLTVLQQCGDTAANDGVSQFWDESMAAYPAYGPVCLREANWSSYMTPLLRPGPEWREVH